MTNQIARLVNDPIMKAGFRFTLSGLLSVCLYLSSLSQEQHPYIINGNAVQDNCNCYTLTPDVLTQAGSVWNKNKIDLRQSFDYQFNVFLGCKDADGADGIVFVLQPISTSIGSTGQGLGFVGVKPSVGIPIDTWQNTDFNDPAYDHIGIYKNGDLVNGTGNTLAGPAPVLDNYGNIEDCQWHVFRISWDAPATTLSAFIDGKLCVQTVTDLVRDIFNNDPEVFWGFSAATGGESNVQKFCTSLNPGFSLPDDQKTCAPAVLAFRDSSLSFGSILKWSWDFGDGTTYEGQDPPPHAYPQPGYYNVKLNILGNNGCLSDTLIHRITIGSKPEAGFTWSPEVVCANAPILLQDASSVQYGNIDTWNWDFSDGTVQSNTNPLSRSFTAGLQQIRLTVQTREGCVSDPHTATINVTEKPRIRLSVEDACYGDPVHLKGTNISPEVAVRQWYWLTGDGGRDSSEAVVHYYPSEGTFPVTLYAENDAGCSSDTLHGLVTIYQTHADAGNDTTVAFGQPLQLHASGGDLYRWMPAKGLDNPYSANPIATLGSSIQYVLMAYTSFGCPTYDTIRVKAYKGPEIYVPNAFTPDGNGHNDRFRAIAAGMSGIAYFNIYNRYGRLIYSSRNISEGWDGTWNGQPQPPDTYIWTIKGTDYQGKDHIEKGTVLLIR
jgi:gliding motility-associated-like protein